MNPIVPGFKYELANFSGTGVQTISFVQRLPEKKLILTKDAKNEFRRMETVNDGTTNEEVLAMLLQRLIHLQHLLPCTENFLACHHIELALTVLTNRTADRVKRNVEGTAQK
jgi:predicted transcriptional regulator